jgi:hypothetical protein
MVVVSTEDRPALVEPQSVTTGHPVRPANSRPVLLAVPTYRPVRPVEARPVHLDPMLTTTAQRSQLAALSASNLLPLLSLSRLPQKRFDRRLQPSGKSHQGTQARTAVRGIDVHVLLSV